MIWRLRAGAPADEEEGDRRTLKPCCHGSPDENLLGCGEEGGIMRTFQRVSRLVRPAIALPVLAGLALAGFLAMGLGCIGGSGRGEVMPSPVVNLRLTDVPVPAGFKFDAEKSFDRQVAGGARSAEHRYEGDTSTQMVSQFYRYNMPLANFGWTQKEETLSNGVRRFTFDRGTEVCYVSIWDNWGTKLLIQVMQKGAKAPEPPARPPAKGSAAK
jgi:hypothetical protein